MNFVEKVPDGLRCDACYGEFALMALCSVFLTAAINKQLAAQASDSTAVASYQADCVRCIDGAAVGVAGPAQGPLLAPEDGARA
jgi:hypothetical protein